MSSLTASSPRLFTCPLGVDLLDSVVDALMSGQLIKGFFPADDPLQFVATTIYVPTRRAKQALSHKIVQRFVSDREAHGVLLPKIIPLADAGDEQSVISDNTDIQALLSTLSPSISPIERRLILAQLILAWGKAMGQAVLPLQSYNALHNPCTDHETIEPLLVPASISDACAMACDLARLLDDMTLWQAHFRDLELLPEERFDDYFKITSEFLRIASEQWPAILSERGMSDPTFRRDSLLRKEADLLRIHGSADPIIAIGSTGTLPSTALFLQAIANLEKGAVVLPALDTQLDGATFEGLQHTLKNDSAAHTHPQAILARLLNHMQVPVRDVLILGQAQQSMIMREKLLSEALRPAETTDLWIEPAHSLSKDERDMALSGVQVIIAQDEREEALAIALAMRETLENPDATVALITPDRTLAERVSAELTRWHIKASDSAGKALMRAQVGSFAALVSEVMHAQKPAHIQALLMHPLTRCGLTQTQHALINHVLSSGVFQGLVPDQGFDVLQKHVVAQAHAAQHDRRSPLPMKRLEPNHWVLAGEFLSKISEIFQTALSIHAGDETQSISQWAQNHARACEALSKDENGISLVDIQNGAEQWHALIHELTQGLPERDIIDLKITAFEYHQLMSAFMREIKVPIEEGELSPNQDHPRVFIWGLLEARLLKADRVILGGLDEQIWPPAAKPDAFLTRSMRLALGLPPPEQRIGQTAHDFVSAMGVEDVILTRAHKRGGSPTVESRFMQRLAAYVGEEAWRITKERGQQYLTIARELDRAHQTHKIKPPMPRPPADMQPQSLSVTEIETLIRDPFAIYAKHILKLNKLEGMRHQLEARDYGTWCHRLFETHFKIVSHQKAVDPRALWQTIVQKSFEPYEAFPQTCALWQARIAPVLEAYTLWDQQERSAATYIAIEAYARTTMMLDDGTAFVLRGTADRIQISDQGAHIIDFKTGSPPSNPQITQGLSPQLTLEMAMLKRGGFETLARFASSYTSGNDLKLSYIKLGGSEHFKQTHVKPSFPKNTAQKVQEDIQDTQAEDIPTLNDVIEDHWNNLGKLLMRHRSGDIPFLSHKMPIKTKWVGDYDHLSRFKEWSATGGEIDDASENMQEEQE